MAGKPRVPQHTAPSGWALPRTPDVYALALMLRSHCCPPSQPRLVTSIYVSICIVWSLSSALVSAACFSGRHSGFLDSSGGSDLPGLRLQGPWLAACWGTCPSEALSHEHKVSCGCLCPSRAERVEGSEGDRGQLGEAAPVSAEPLLGFPPGSLALMSRCPQESLHGWGRGQGCL